MIKRFGSFDTFLSADSFWQDRMGKPVANQEFLKALLLYGTSEEYHFFCDDEQDCQRFLIALEELVDAGSRKRVTAHPKSDFVSVAKNTSMDILHHGDFTYFMPYVMEMRNRLNLPCCVSGVTHSLDGAWLQTRFLQLLLAHPAPGDAIFCTSGCTERMLAEAFGGVRDAFHEAFQVELPEPPKSILAPLGLPDRSFVSHERLYCRRQLGFRDDTFVLLSLGRFSPRHKADLSPLLEAYHWVRTETGLQDIVLVLAGAAEPKDLSLIREIVRQYGLMESVRFEANVDSDRKAFLFGAADVFVSMVDNFQETFGLAIIEAMAQGLPVIASDFNGYKELVDHDQTGFLIPTYASPDFEPWSAIMGVMEPSLLRFHHAQKIAFSIGRFVEAVVALATQPRLRYQMGVRARVRSLRYQWKNLIPTYEEHWQHQVGENRKHAVARPSSRPAFLTPDPERVFGHYPSRWLRQEDRVAVTEYGRKRHHSRFRPIVYDRLEALLTETLNDRLLETLGDGNMSVAQLSETVSRLTGLPVDKVLLQIDWLLKHGYLEPVLRPG